MIVLYNPGASKMRLTNPVSVDPARGLGSITTNVFGPEGLFSMQTAGAAASGLAGFSISRLVSAPVSGAIDRWAPDAMSGAAITGRLVLALAKTWLGTGIVNSLLSGPAASAALAGLYTEVVHAAILKPWAEQFEPGSWQRRLGMSDDAGGRFSAISPHTRVAGNYPTRRLGRTRFDASYGGALGSSQFYRQLAGARAGSWGARARSPYNARGLGQSGSFTQMLAAGASGGSY